MEKLTGSDSAAVLGWPDTKQKVNWHVHACGKTKLTVLQSRCQGHSSVNMQCSKVKDRQQIGSGHKWKDRQ